MFAADMNCPSRNVLNACPAGVSSSGSHCPTASEVSNATPPAHATFPTHEFASRHRMGKHLDGSLSLIYIYIYIYIERERDTHLYYLYLSAPRISRTGIPTCAEFPPPRAAWARFPFEPGLHIVMYVSVWVYIHTYTCIIDICTYVFYMYYMYVYIYIYTHTFTG